MPNCRKWAFAAVAITSTAQHCQQCTACIPARIPAAHFSPNRQQRRILKRNEDISVRCVRPAFTEEYYDLYVRYIEQRHADGDMYPPSR